MMTRLALTAGMSLLLATGARLAGDTQRPHVEASTQNTLSAEDTAGGWTSLFDGKTATGWRGFRKSTFPATGWVVVGGTLKSLGQKGGDIVTTTSYTDFELSWEWRLSPQGNSGVKYFVDEQRGNSTGAIGHEYQMIDDENYAVEPLNAKMKTGAWYDVLAPARAAARPIGAFNQSRLVVDGNIVEHWLNGTLVLRYDITSPEAAAGVAASKFKDVPGYGTKISTPILLQDHNTVVWFRNIRIRALPAR